MMPEKRLSTQPIIAQFQSADALPHGKLTDYEQGGVAIGDPTQGLNVQTWELSLLGANVRVRPYPDGAFTTVFSAPGITELSLAFDQNMNPTIAYMANGLAKLRWFDATKSKFVITTVPGARDIRVCLDDKRPVMRDFSDILVFYMKDTAGSQFQRVFMRQQRDRFLVEYTIGYLPEGTTNLFAVGMAKNHRLRFEIVGHYPDTSADPRRDIPPYPPGFADATGLQLVLDQPYPAFSSSLKFEFELYQPPVSDPYP